MHGTGFDSKISSLKGKQHCAGGAKSRTHLISLEVRRAGKEYPYVLYHSRRVQTIDVLSHINIDRRCN